MNVMVFDIETVPDVESGARLYDLDGLPPADVANAMFALRQEKTGSDFLQHHLHRIVAISIVLRTRDSLKVWSLGDEGADEGELVARFFDGIERYTPTLVTWNGGGFDLPVLHYRALLHGISAPRYWETGNEDTSFRYNNYLARFHWRHVDLMDVLSGYQARAVARLDEVATMLGFPGKMGMDGSKVWDAFLEGRIADIRNYCETDVLNTWLVWLRFEVMRGVLTADQCEAELKLVRDTLTQAGKPHLDEFLAAWTG